MSVEKFIRIERSHRRVLLIAITVIAVFGLYRWILAPHTEQLLAAERYNSTLNEVIHKAGVIGDLQEAKKSKIEELAKESDRLRNQLFTPHGVRQFLASLPSVANQAGCAAQSVIAVPDTPQNSQSDGSGIVAKKATVIVTGGYNDLIKFFEALQTSEHKVWIDSVTIDSGAAGKLKCQVMLALYCLEHVENN
jgi:Tfp pilus assembly protein PilO